MNVGDVITIAGIKRVERNSRWRWWTPWRKRFFVTTELQRFKITKKY